MKARLCGLVSWRSGSEGLLSPFLLPGHFGFHALARGILFSLRLRGRSAVHWFDRGSVFLAKEVLEETHSSYSAFHDGTPTYTRAPHSRLLPPCDAPRRLTCGSTSGAQA